MNKKLARFAIIVSILTILLAACGGTSEPPQPVEPTAPQAEAATRAPVGGENLESAAGAPATEPQGESIESAAGASAEGQAAPTAAPVPELAPGQPSNFVFVQHALCSWDPFWCTIEDGIQQAAQHMNVSATVLGPDQFDLDQVAALIDQAVATRPDGLAVTIPDIERLREPIQRALDAGIPVVAYNSGSGREADGLDYLTFLGSDEAQGGYLSAIRLADAGATSGVCINHQVGHVGLDARCEGFLSAMDVYGLPAQVLPVTADPAESQAIIADFYTANPGTDAFLTLGPGGATPFYAFMQAAGLAPGSVKHGTFDLSDEIIARIKDGTTLYAVDQKPFLQGYSAVQTLMLNTRYGIQPVLDVTPTGPGFIDANNVDFQVDPNRAVNLALVQHARCAQDPFWCGVEAGIEQAARDAGVFVTIQGPEQFDIDQMVALVDQAVSAQPDGLAVTVPNANRLRASIQQALDSGIQVVAYNTGAGPLVDNVEYLTYLGMDRFYQTEGGYQSGLALASVGGNRAVCINHEVGQSSLDARCEGFANAMNEQGIPVEVLAITKDPAQAEATIAEYYSAHPDADIFLTLGPSGAAPYYGFLAAAGLGPDAIKHGTFDLTKESAARIKDGTTLFVIDQQPFLQGYGAVQTLVLKLRYGIDPVVPVMPTGPVVVQASNVEQVDDLLGE
ncbi:MAG: substrate-binding domain-containing protein [Anaerolineae bacterium]